MSDVSQGPGWWKASDGKWYRPEQHPNYQPPPPPAPSPPNSLWSQSTVLSTTPAPQSVGPAPQSVGPAPQSVGPAPQSVGPAPQVPVMAGQVQALQQVERYVRERRDTDQAFVSWGLYFFLLSSVNIRIYPIIIFYRRLNRADLFRNRKENYYRAVLEYTRQYAAGDRRL